MKKLPLITRILLGLIFFVFGLNGFFNFIPLEGMPPMPEKAVAFTTGMAASGYFFPFLKGVEVLCGFLLLTGAFVPLAIVVLAPIIINIALFHFLLAHNGYPMTIFLIALEGYLAFFAEPYASIVKQIFRLK